MSSDEHERRRPIRVLVADAHRLVIEGIRRALDLADDLEVVADVYNRNELLSAIERAAPDLVLLDWSAPVGAPTDLSAVRQRHPSIKVIVLSATADPARVQAALKHGAVGYILTTINPADLPSALRQAYEGTVYHALGAPEESAAVAKAAGLTPREIAILAAVARGSSNRSIARELWVTEQTVKFHLTNIYRKLGVANRTEAAHYAFQHGLVTAGTLDAEQ